MILQIIDIYIYILPIIKYTQTSKCTFEGYIWQKQMPFPFSHMFHLLRNISCNPSYNVGRFSSREITPPNVVRWNYRKSFIKGNSSFKIKEIYIKIEVLVFYWCTKCCINHWMSCRVFFYIKFILFYVHSFYVF